MKLIKNIFGLVSAFLCIFIVLAIFVANGPLSERLARLPFMKVDPIYTGGNVMNIRESRDSCSRGMTVAIHEAVFSSLIGTAECGYIQIDFIPSENEELPSSISETLDLDADGFDELRITIDTGTGETNLNVCPSKGYSVLNSAKVDEKWILRVGMRNPEGKCSRCPQKGCLMGVTSHYVR